MRKVIAFIVLIAVLIQPTYASFNLEKWYIKEDLRSLDLSLYEDLATKLCFSNRVLFPGKDKLPKGFDPLKLLAWGDSPVLNIKAIHAQGFTGKGVTIAYIDQPLTLVHLNDGGSFNHIKIHNQLLGYDSSENEKHYHGNLVLNVLAGKRVGVAPDAEIYFVGHPAWFADQRTHAQSIYRIIEINKSLPKDKKIRIIGFSDTVDYSEKYPEVFAKAIKDAESAGIMVFTCADRIYEGSFIPYSDRNRYENIFVNSAYRTSPESVVFPTSHTYPGIESDMRVYTPSGGLSSATPFMVGLAAIALQINSKLTKADIEMLMEQTSHRMDGFRGVINPEGFVEAVKSTVDARDYLIVLYNSRKMSKEDLQDLEKYLTTLNTGSSRVVSFDYQSDSPESAYETLKHYHSLCNSKPLGVQIIGTSSVLPAFSIKDIVEMNNSKLHEGGEIVSDHFWSTLVNDYSQISSNASLKSLWENREKVDLLPQWPVSRLLVTEGGFSKYYKKWTDYSKSIKEESNLPLTSFASPIFPSNHHLDNFDSFVRSSLIRGGILDPKQFSGYLNTKGVFGLSGQDYNKDNLKSENERGILNFVFSGHGQSNNIDRCYFTAPNENGEVRESFVNADNVNDVLGKNYYNLFQWNCWGASNLSEESLVYSMQMNGKSIHHIASSYLISNNGIDYRSHSSGYRDNNPFLLVDAFYRALYQSGLDYSNSLFQAKQKYIAQLLSNPLILGRGNNAQFNLMNALGFVHLGLIKPTGEKAPGAIVRFQHDGKSVKSERKTVTLQLIQLEGNSQIRLWNADSNQFNEIPTTVFHKDYTKVPFRTSLKTSKIHSVALRSDKEDLYIKVEFTRLQSGSITVFLQGDAPGLKTMYQTNHKGNLIVEIQIKSSDAKKFEIGLAINLSGDSDFIFIDKTDIDQFLK